MDHQSMSEEMMNAFLANFKTEEQLEALIQKASQKKLQVYRERLQNILSCGESIKCTEVDTHGLKEALSDSDPDDDIQKILQVIFSVEGLTVDILLVYGGRDDYVRYGVTTITTKVAGDNKKSMPGFTNDWFFSGMVHSVPAKLIQKVQSTFKDDAQAVIKCLDSIMRNAAELDF